MLPRSILETFPFIGSVFHYLLVQLLEIFIFYFILFILFFIWSFILLYFFFFCLKIEKN